MIDPIRAKLETHIVHAGTPEEKELAEALLYGYNVGELEVLTDLATGDLLFNVALPN